jgi:oligoribonuclease
VIDLKRVIPTKLLWLDLEMTGLDSGNDVILEVAVEVTDFDFNTLGSYDSRVKQKRATVIERMNKNVWWKDFPANRDDFLNNLEAGKELKTVEKELVAFVQKHFHGEPAVIAGNSIHNDRLFINRWWPEFQLKLHYRMLDVSSFKVLMQGKYGENFEKQDVHRAYDDIQASIAELQYYLGWFKEHGSQDR